MFGPGAEPARARHVILATNGLTYLEPSVRNCAAAAALVMPFADTQAMNEHLAEIAKTVVPGAHAVIVLDGAGWHGSKALCTPDNITLLPLPPYAPELNPIENVWAYLRANKLAISIFDSYDHIVEKCCDAWNFFAEDKETVQNITSREYAKSVHSIRPLV